MSHLVIAAASAEFSTCRRYRYTLTRRFASGPSVAFIGLNPSTADETQDDPTIRRCLGFARRWGFGELLMLNLYTLRSTAPSGLWGVPEPVGADCSWGNVADVAIALGANTARMVICAWGANPGPVPDRPAVVLRIVEDAGARAFALGLTRDGQPRHPLRVRADVDPVPFP